MSLVNSKRAMNYGSEWWRWWMCVCMCMYVSVLVVTSNPTLHHPQNHHHHHHRRLHQYNIYFEHTRLSHLYWQIENHFPSQLRTGNNIHSFNSGGSSTHNTNITGLDAGDRRGESALYSGAEVLITNRTEQLHITASVLKAADAWRPKQVQSAVNVIGQNLNPDQNYQNFNPYYLKKYFLPI